MVDPDDRLTVKLVCLRWLGHLILFLLHMLLRARNSPLPRRQTPPRGRFLPSSIVRIAGASGTALTCIKSAEPCQCFDAVDRHANHGRNVMYRNLLVHIPTGRSPRPAVDG